MGGKRSLGRIGSAYVREASLSWLRALCALIAFATLSGQSIPPPYSQGQVWEYKTRVGDEGSLLKIQRIEREPAGSKLGAIYHISVVGFHLRNPAIVPMLPHAPVSQQTLDESVTRLSTIDRSFPPADPGIAEWKQAKGGVFTITVAEIVEILDQQTAAQGQQEAKPDS